jgi:hypothetical protein
MVPTMYTGSLHETRYGQSEAELRGILLGLETAGFPPRAVIMGDAPDALVTLDGGPIWVEHAEVIDPVSARYTNMMSDLDRDIKDAIAADPAANMKLHGQLVEIRLGACPKKSEVQRVRNALIELLRNGDHISFPERHLYKLTKPEPLTAIGTSLYRPPWPHGESGGSPFIIHIQSAAHSFDPLSLAPIAMRRLDVKRKLASRYAVAPLWLVLSVTDIRGIWDASMAQLGAGCPTIEPYDRVIVCDAGRALIWSQGVMAIRNLHP